MSGTDNRVTSGGINVFDIAQEIARAIAEAGAATANDSQVSQNKSAPIVNANTTAFAERTGTTSDYARQFFQNRFALQTSNTPQASPNANNVGDGNENNVPLPGAVTLYATGAGDTNQIDLNDISQGNIGDCYLMSAMGAVARSHPEIIQHMIMENRDGDGNIVSYTVTFHEKDNGFLGIPGLFGQSGDKEVKITVDATFPSGDNHAGTSSSDTDSNGRTEIWPLIIEKAYAQYKGGYDDIGGGGDPANTLSAITGRDTNSVSPGDYSFETLQKDLSDGRAIVYDTKDLDRGFFERTFDGILNRTPRDEHPYQLVGDHAYMVTGAYTDADGQQMVTLRNPWGYNDPKPIPYAQAQQYSDGIRVN
jgi:hypothetical protein